MILTAKQTTRLSRLLLSLGISALELEGDSDTLGELERGDPDGWAGVQMVNYIWGEDRIDGIIDRFLEDNSDHLSRGDIKQVQDWKSGVYGDFVVVRKERDVYFLTDDYAFVVRGTDDEVDHYLSYTPIMITTAVLPFDGLITFAIYFSEYDQAESPYLDEATAWAHIEELSQAKRLARNEQDFMRLSEECRDVLWRLHCDRSAERSKELVDRFDHWYEESGRELDEDEELASEDDLASFVDDLLGEEGNFDLAADFVEMFMRETIMDAVLDGPDMDYMLDGSDMDDMLDELDERCEPGEPVYGLKDIFASHDDTELRTMCLASLDYNEATLRAMSHNRLVEAAVRSIVSHPDSLVQFILQEGSEDARNVRTLIEAEGTLLLEIDGLTEYTYYDTLQPLFPIIFVFHEGDDYRFVMPDEVREALQDVNLDHVEADALAIEDAEFDVVQALDYRGIAPADDLANEAIGRYQFHRNIENIRTALSLRIGLQRARGAICFIDDAPYLISMSLLDACDGTTEPGSGILTNPEPAATVLERRSSIRPRPIDEFRDEKEVVDRVMELDSWRQLEDALTKCASKGSVTSFALMDVVELFVTDCQLDEDATEVFFDVLDEVGVEVAMRHRTKLAPAIEAFVDDIPRWDLNGWSHNDLRKSLRVR